MNDSIPEASCLLGKKMSHRELLGGEVFVQRRPPYQGAVGEEYGWQSGNS